MHHLPTTTNNMSLLKTKTEEIKKLKETMDKELEAMKKSQCGEECLQQVSRFEREMEELESKIERLDAALVQVRDSWDEAITFSEELRKTLMEGAISCDELPHHFAVIADDEERQRVFGDMPNKWNEENKWQDHWQQKNKKLRKAFEEAFVPEEPPTKKPKAS